MYNVTLRKLDVGPYLDEKQGWSVRTHCVVLLAATMLITGCAEDRNDALEQTHSPAPTRAELPSPAAEEEAEQQALDAYLGLMGAVVEASLEGAQDHPDLEVYARGQALELASDMLDGATATGEPVLRPEVTESDPEGEPPTAVVEDCMDSTAWVLEEHPEVSPAEQSTRLYTATVTSVDGDWRVEDLWLGEPNAC